MYLPHFANLFAVMFYHPGLANLKCLHRAGCHKIPCSLLINWKSSIKDAQTQVCQQNMIIHESQLHVSKALIMRMQSLHRMHAEPGSFNDISLRAKAVF
jgi:hypothetical protein